jgi:hypothetical protein
MAPRDRGGKDCDAVSVTGGNRGIGKAMGIVNLISSTGIVVPVDEGRHLWAG